MTKTINVTKDDILRGVKWDSSSCPIALALRRQFKTKLVDVDNDDITIRRAVLLTPKRAQRFLVRFDSGSRVRPFCFKLTLP